MYRKYCYYESSVNFFSNFDTLKIRTLCPLHVPHILSPPPKMNHNANIQVNKLSNTLNSNLEYTSF